MILAIENSLWHAFDYLAVESGRSVASKSKLKVGSNEKLEREIVITKF